MLHAQLLTFYLFTSKEIVLHVYVFAHISCMSCMSGMTVRSSGIPVFLFLAVIYKQLKCKYFMTSSVWWRTLEILL